ncbi:hypothetical protein BOTBODRAFT_30227 [Botryobasidium botryosum FD-172 SS1]|uniref:Uncharacterized protein n=1 Tax=Botryobasidium botryosum (strain FD-172 SS1) TaxID=930990 RepID=A0A067MPF7_BOTB1|nr:hypothetical protein BOTBODRAFT_30227 [Botryobasidium botryosum FD-172 SS1]
MSSSPPLIRPPPSSTQRQNGSTIYWDTAQSRHRPIHKRPRLATHSSSPATFERPTRLVQVLTPANEGSETKVGSVPPVACGTCMRLFNSGAGARPGTYIFCPRCYTPTCQICARTCTTAPATSIPPTPLLSYSPSPPPFKSLPLPGDTIIDDDVAGTTEQSGHKAAAGRVRAREDNDKDSEEDDSAGDGGVANLKGGCGQKVCRRCCIEDGNSTTCTACLNLPYSRHDEDFMDTPRP